MKLEPQPLNIVCSACGLDWEKHGKKPTPADCIKLFKAELAKRPTHLSMSAATYPTTTWNYAA
jgi:hypothetical protein